MFVRFHTFNQKRFSRPVNGKMGRKKKRCRKVLPILSPHFLSYPILSAVTIGCRKNQRPNKCRDRNRKITEMDLARGGIETRMRRLAKSSLNTPNGLHVKRFQSARHSNKLGFLEARSRGRKGAQIRVNAPATRRTSNDSNDALIGATSVRESYHRCRSRPR